MFYCYLLFCSITYSIIDTMKNNRHMRSMRKTTISITYSKPERIAANHWRQDG